MNLLGLRDRSPRMSCTTDVKLMVLDLRVFNRCCEERLFLNASIFMSVPWWILFTICPKLYPFIINRYPLFFSSFNFNTITSVPIARRAFTIAEKAVIEATSRFLCFLPSRGRTPVYLPHLVCKEDIFEQLLRGPSSKRSSEDHWEWVLRLNHLHLWWFQLLVWFNWADDEFFWWCKFSIFSLFALEFSWPYSNHPRFKINTAFEAISVHFPWWYIPPLWLWCLNKHITITQRATFAS